MALWSSIPCWEESSTNEENWTFENRTTSVVLRCLWPNRHLLAADLLENQREWPHGFLTEQPKAQSVKIRPHIPSGSAGNCMVYEHALLSVTYGFDTSDLIAESLEPTIEFITEDYRKFRWKTDDKALVEGEAPGRQRIRMDLVRTLYNVPGPLPAILLTGMGGINNALYYSSLLELAFAQGTLLYHPPALDRTITTQGSKGYTIPLRFTYEPNGWNKYWRAETQTWDEIVTLDGSDYVSYPEVDFSAILF